MITGKLSDPEYGHPFTDTDFTNMDRMRSFMDSEAALCIPTSWRDHTGKSLMTIRTAIEEKMIYLDVGGERRTVYLKHANPLMMVVTLGRLFDGEEQTVYQNMTDEDTRSKSRRDDSSNTSPTRWLR